MLFLEIIHVFYYQPCYEDYQRTMVYNNRTNMFLQEIRVLFSIIGTVELLSITGLLLQTGVNGIRMHQGNHLCCR